MSEIAMVLANAIADATQCGVDDYPAPYESQGIPAADLAPDVLANIEAAGYIVVPLDPTEAMLAAAGPSMKRVNDLLASRRCIMRP